MPGSGQDELDTNPVDDNLSYLGQPYPNSVPQGSDMYMSTTPYQDGTYFQDIPSSDLYKRPRSGFNYFVQEQYNITKSSYPSYDNTKIYRLVSTPFRCD